MISAHSRIGGSLRKAGTLTFSASNSAELTGLTGNKKYIFFWRLQNTEALGANLVCFVNSDTTGTNYYTQYIVADGAGLSAGRSNDNGISSMSGDVGSTGEAKVLMDADGYIHIDSLSAPSLTNDREKPTIEDRHIVRSSSVQTEITAIGISCVKDITGTVDIYEVI